MWISRCRRHPSDDSSAEPALPASSADTEAPPATAASAPATTAIVGAVPILIRRRQEGPIPILQFRSFSVPRFSTLPSSRRQFINVTDSPAMTAIMVRPVLRQAQLPTFSSRRQEVALWWQKIFYMMFGSSVSRTGHMVYTCIIVEISFSLTGVTVSVSRFIRGSGPTLVMLPPAGDSDDTTITLLPLVRLPTSVPVQPISPPVPVAGAPRAELAAGPISTTSSDRQLSVAISPCLSHANFRLPSSEGSGIFFSSDDSFFSSGGSSSSLSPTTSGSSEEIEAAHFDEISLDFASPLSPAVSHTAMSPPPSLSAISAAPPIPQVDEAAQRFKAWRKEKCRRYARRVSQEGIRVSVTQTSRSDRIVVSPQSPRENRPVPLLTHIHYSSSIILV